MAHRIQYKKDIRLSQQDQLELAYYKSEIQKVKRQYSQIQNDYNSKILSLTRRLKFGKKKIFFNEKTSAQNVREQLDKCNQQIKSLKEKIDNSKKYQQQLQNSRLYPDPMHKIIELTHQIVKLKKSLNQIKSKYDGNKYTQHKIKTCYDSLRNQNQELRYKIKQIQKEKSLRNQTEIVNYDQLQTVKEKNKYKILKNQNDNIQKLIELKINRVNGINQSQDYDEKLKLKKESILSLKQKNIALIQLKNKLISIIEGINFNKNKEKLLFYQNYQESQKKNNSYLKDSNKELFNSKSLDNTFA